MTGNQEQRPRPGQSAAYVGVGLIAATAILRLWTMVDLFMFAACGREGRRVMFIEVTQKQNGRSI
jgi:hypothetical protein